MASFMSAVAREHVEESVDAQPRRLEGKYAELAELANDAEYMSFGGLFWEFVADEMMLEDDE